MKSIISILVTLLLIFSLTGCSEGARSDISGEDIASSAQAESDFSSDEADMFTKRDQNSTYSTDESVTVTLNGDEVKSSSAYAKTEGSVVTLTEEATYIISGTLTDGCVIVDAPDTAKLQIVLDGAHITSSNSAAIFVLSADKVVITLADRSENSLANGGEFESTDYGIDAALFSKQDLSFNGNGSLEVISPAGHGIVSKDDLVITSGVYYIASASHGIDANDSIRLSGATLTVEAGKDALHAENKDDASLGFIYVSSGELKLTAEGDGISAGAYVQIENGSFDITAGGGSENGTKEHSDNYGGFGGGMGMGGGPGKPGGRSGYEGTAGAPLNGESSSDDSASMKGIKAVSGILINGGQISINSADDSIHSNSDIIINGGEMTLASGDDGIHGDDTVTVSGGSISVTESYEGIEAHDLQLQGGIITIKATDDGLNSAGGTDSSGIAGGRDGAFGGGPGVMSSGDGSIVISGGTVYVNASGDGIDSNGRLEISGGHTTVVGPTQGDTSTLDYDTEGIITGGTFIGTGASGMAQSFSDSEQGVIALNVGSQSAGTFITVKDNDGNEIISASPEFGFQVVIVSCPELEKGETYSVSVGDVSGEFESY